MVEVIGEIVVRLILAVLLLPTMIVLATPVILISAPFRPGRIRADYAGVTWWVFNIYT